MNEWIQIYWGLGLKLIICLHHQSNVQSKLSYWSRWWSKKLSGMVASVLERLEAGEVIIGDGSYVFTLEKRGYVQAGDSLENWSLERLCLASSWDTIEPGWVSQWHVGQDIWWRLLMWLAIGDTYGDDARCGDGGNWQGGRHEDLQLMQVAIFCSCIF